MSDHSAEMEHAEYVLALINSDLTKECDQLRDALRAGYMIHRGRACIRTSKDIPREIIDPARERLIREALQEAGYE